MCITMARKSTQKDTFHVQLNIHKLEMHWTTHTCVCKSLQWRHKERDGVSNHRRLYCLLAVSSGADQRKHQSSASLAFVHRSPVVPLTKGPVTRKCFHLMTSSWFWFGIDTLVKVRETSCFEFVANSSKMSPKPALVIRLETDSVRSCWVMLRLCSENPNEWQTD